MAEIIRHSGFGYVNSVQFYEGKKVVATWYEHPEENYRFSEKKGVIINGKIKAINLTEKIAIDIGDARSHLYAVIEYEDNIMKDQIVKWYFDDYNSGILALVEAYNNEMRNGVYQAYYDDGKLSVEGNYVDNKREGLWKFYYPSGKIRLKVLCKNGKDISIEKFSQKKWWKFWKK